MPRIISLFRKHLRVLGGVLLISTISIGAVGSASSATRAQEVTGNIQGEVKDQAGGLVHNATVTATSEQLLKIVKAVKSDWFGVNLDTGNFHTDDPYADLARIAPYAVTVQIKTEIQRAGRKKEDADLRRLLDILRGADYRGYVALEYEAAEDPKTAVPRQIEALKKLMG